MKRWNQKGSKAALVRMAELRDRKRRLLQSELIEKWAAHTGRPANEWWEAAKASGPVPEFAEARREFAIAFLRSELGCTAA